MFQAYSEDPILKQPASGLFESLLGDGVGSEGDLGGWRHATRALED